MYLLQLEFDELHKAETISDSDKKAADEGILTIVDISTPQNPKEYIDGQWVELKSWGEE